MDKELAIRILRGEVLGTNEQTHEAVFMAIKALKEQSNTDPRIIKIINLIKSLLERGETGIEIHMHSKYATVITDGAVGKNIIFILIEVEE